MPTIAIYHRSFLEDICKVLGEYNSLLHKRTRVRLAEKSTDLDWEKIKGFKP